MLDYKDDKETTLDLAKLKEHSPSAYYYIKGYIHHAIDKQIKPPVTAVKKHKSSA